MKKLKLNLDELRVESFVIPDISSNNRGTVNGQQLPASGDTNCPTDVGCGGGGTGYSCLCVTPVLPCATPTTPAAGCPDTAVGPTCFLSCYVTCDPPSAGPCGCY